MTKTENHNFTDTLLPIDSILDFSDIEGKEYLYDFEPAPPLAVHENSEIFFPGKGIYVNDYLSTYKGNFLPHWELTSTVYHVSFRLGDSVPAATQRKWLEEINKLLEKYTNEHNPLTDDEKRRLQKLYSETIEKYLDSGYGSCILRNPDAARIVKDSLLHYNEMKYILHAWCIMPNHVHAIFQLLNNLMQSEIIQGWKSFTAHAINKLLNRKGALWQADCYNHIIRTPDEYFNQIWYVWNNPQKAGLSNWEWRWKCFDS